MFKTSSTRAWTNMKKKTRLAWYFDSFDRLGGVIGDVNVHADGLPVVIQLHRRVQTSKTYILYMFLNTTLNVTECIFTTKAEGRTVLVSITNHQKKKNTELGRNVNGMKEAQLHGRKERKRKCLIKDTHKIFLAVYRSYISLTSLIIDHDLQGYLN